MSDTSPFPSPFAGDDEILAFIRAAHVVDLAEWLSHLPPSQSWQYLQDLEPGRQPAVFAYLSPDIQAAVAGQAPQDALARILAGMDADDRAGFFNRLSPPERSRLLGLLRQELRDDIDRLSEHDEGCAGSLMTSDYALLDQDMTAAEAIEALRKQAPGKETIYRSYVVDAGHRLIGSLRLHALIVAPETAIVRDLMEPQPIAVTLDTDQEDVARMIARYDLLALPVVGAQGHLMGIVTHDDAADVMEAAATEDFHKQGTVLPVRQSMRQAGIGMLYSRRIVWLALLVFGNLFSGAGIAYFEDTILAYVSLVFFLPLLIDSSGNAGAQSATLMVRALATGDVEMKDWRDLILREMAIAAALGATMAAVVFPLGAWRGGADVGLTVGLTMFVVVIIGSLVGMSLPFLLSRLKLDPATASGPLVTTISDAVGVLIYFSIATMILSL